MAEQLKFLQGYRRYGLVKSNRRAPSARRHRVFRSGPDRLPPAEPVMSGDWMEGWNTFLGPEASMVSSPLKRSQSALQVDKEQDCEEDVAHKKQCATVVPAPSTPPASSRVMFPQMMRSQSASQIYKEEISHQAHDQSDAMKAAISAKRSGPPASPEESPLKRSQSALQVWKMARTGSCGHLADLDPPTAHKLGVA